MDEAMVWRMLKEAAINEEKGTTGNILGINTMRDCLAPACRRKQIQALAESACRQVYFKDALDPGREPSRVVVLQWFRSKAGQF